MNPQDRIYAVLTGDLVESSKLSAEASNAALDLLRDAVRQFGETHPGSVSLPLDSFRHDSWQLLLERPELALRAAVFLRASLKMASSPEASLDSRIAVGLGTVETVSEDRVSRSRGPAFTHSGKALDAMGDARIAWARAGRADSAAALLAGAAVPLLDCVVNGWTAKESRAVHGTLAGRTQAQIAEGWPLEAADKPLTRQAISDSLRRAQWSRVETALECAETEIRTLIASRRDETA